MTTDSIGSNIRRYRREKRIRQEDLAEKANVSTNYIGMVERGEKTPSLETFIAIINALDISSDMILADVITCGYRMKATYLSDRLAGLSENDRNRILDVVETLLKYT